MLFAPGRIEPSDEPPACKLGNERVYSFTVGSGDNLQKIVDQVGGGPWTTNQVNRVLKRYYKKYYDFDWLSPSVRIDIGMSKAGVPRWFRYRPNITAGICAVREGREAWAVRRLDLPIDRDHDLVSIEAQPSLEAAIEDLGEDPALLPLIEEIFPKTKIDSIQLLVEKLSVEGEFLTYTRVLAAEARSKGKSMRAFFYRHPNGLGGYYTDTGVPLQATRLYHPVPNGFQVSNYGMRKHPILRWRRNHKGIDYAAPMDTVVHAAADGVVTEARYYGPLGRVVVVEHGRGLVTRYAHLNRYADGVKPGMLVKRGDPIGHIGTSGLSTGAHLHFETLLNDEHVNPARVNTPPPPAITDDLLPDFEKHVTGLLKQLDLRQSASHES